MTTSFFATGLATLSMMLISEIQAGSIMRLVPGFIRVSIFYRLFDYYVEFMLDFYKINCILHKKTSKMLQQKDIIKYLKAHKKQFAKQFDVIKIGIFGSFARNEQTEESDIDIIIEMPKDTENIFEKRLMLKEFLSKHFSKRVDVCHKRAIKPIFREKILKDVIYV